MKAQRSVFAQDQWRPSCLVGAGVLIGGSVGLLIGALVFGAILLGRIQKLEKVVATSIHIPTVANTPVLTKIPSATANLLGTQDKIATITQMAFERVSLHPTQTKEAILALTSTAVAPFNASATSNAKGATRLAGPLEGTLPHKQTVQGDRFTVPAAKALDFIVEATFTNPYDANTEGRAWDHGFFFRRTASSEYVLLVSSANFWSLYSSINSGVQIAPLENRPMVRGILDIAADAENTVSLQARGDKALLFINDQFIAEFDLPAAELNVAGGFGVVTGYLTGDGSFGRETKYAGLTVLELK